MSLAILHSRALSGMDAPLVTVEVHLANGLPSFQIVQYSLTLSNKLSNYDKGIQLCEVLPDGVRWFGICVYCQATQS